MRTVGTYEAVTNCASSIPAEALGSLPLPALLRGVAQALAMQIAGVGQ